MKTSDIFRDWKNGSRSFDQFCLDDSMRSAMSRVCVVMVTGLNIMKGVGSKKLETIDEMS